MLPAAVRRGYPSLITLLESTSSYAMTAALELDRYATSKGIMDGGDAMHAMDMSKKVKPLTKLPLHTLLNLQPAKH